MIIAHQSPAHQLQYSVQLLYHHFAEMPTPLVISKPTLGSNTIYQMTTINPKLPYH